MKTKLITLTALVVFAAAACKNKGEHDKKHDTMHHDTPTASSDMKNEEPMPELDAATKQKNMMDYATPGESHKFIASMAGDWTFEMSMYMHPDSPAMKSTGTSTYKTMMNGLFTSSTIKSMMMGQPFEGMGTMGYDNAKKKFVSTWIDNYSSGIMMMEGTWDDASKTLTMAGKGTDPETLRECEMKEVMKVVDDNTCTSSMYVVKDGKETKMFDMTMKRKGKKA